MDNTLPPPDELKQIILSADGRVLRKLPTKDDLKIMEKNSFYLIIGDEDQNGGVSKNIPLSRIRKTSWIMDSILQQRILNEPKNEE